MIPKTIHYVWVGPNPLPESDRLRVEEWGRLLPDWKIVGWNNDTVDYSSKYLRQAYSVQAWNRVSDYVRMDALSRYGGVYLDTDVELLRPLDPLLHSNAFLGFQTDEARFASDMVNGAVFGAEAGHWLPSSIRDYFNNCLDGRENIGSFSGPGLLTKFLREKGLENYSDCPVTVADVTLFPKRYFYPYSWLEEYTEGSLTADTYAIHRWAESWVIKKGNFARKVRRHLLKRFSQVAPELAFRMSYNMVNRGSNRRA